MSEIWVAEGVAHDGSTTVTLRVADKKFNSKPTDTPASTHFMDRLANVVIHRSLFSDGKTSGRSRIGTGELILRNEDGALDAWKDYGFTGRTWTVYRGDPATQTYPSGFTKMFVGTALQPTGKDELRLKLRDNQLKVEIPFQTTKYAGNNALPAGLEGVAADLKGKPKPILLGKRSNIPAVCVNTSKLIYQVNDGAIQEITEVRDMGVPLSYTPYAWVERTSGVVTDLNAVASDGGSVFVAVGDAGVIRRSTDGGVTWAAAASSPLSGSPNLHSVAYDATIGKFVLGGASQTLYHSTDGSTWTQISGGSNPFGAGETINHIASNGTGTFVAVGSAGVSANSTNGTSFTSRANSFAGAAISVVAWGRDKFVMIGGVHAETSPTGVTWTARSDLPSTGTVTALTFGLNLFVAADSGARLYSSVDGIEWTLRFAPTSGTFLIVRGLAFGGTMRQFIGVGEHTLASSGRLLTSADGINWTARVGNMTATEIGRGVAASATYITAVGDGGQIEQPDTSGTYGSEADLLDDTLAPKPGTVKVYLAGGLFRLGSAPIGQITCDAAQGAAASNRTAAQLFATALDERLGMASGDWSAADVTAADVDNGSECGIWVGPTESPMGSEILDRIAATPGAAWFLDKDGVFRFQVLKAPSSGSSILTIAANDMVRAIERVQSADDTQGIPPWRVIVRHNQNHAPQSLTDLAGGVTDAKRSEYGAEWREEKDEDSAIKTKHLLAPELVIETLFTTAANASTEADRVLTLKGSTDRDQFTTTIGLDTTTMAVDLGKIVTIEHDRFSLSAGKKFAVLGIRQEAAPQLLSLEVWG